jgi:CDP-glucose 4,6-dehydratase
VFVPTPPMLQAWRGRRVLLTGCTGFKGAWLARWLHHLGAEVHGLALDPPTDPSLWDRAGLLETLPWHRVDVRDRETVARLVRGLKPNAVLHLAAQALVGEGLRDPVATFETNAMGTLSVLDAVRRADAPCAVVVVTTDKVYAPRPGTALREGDPLGGEDPYSASKACAELVTGAYRASYFPPGAIGDHGIAVATVRAGNVVGPGDFTPSRLVPHVLEAVRRGEAPTLRNPDGIRPWQHVLEPLAGYLALGAGLLPGAPDPAPLCTAWNLGPWPDAARPVRDVVAVIEQVLGGGDAPPKRRPDPHPETATLRLAVDRAVSRLPWRPAYRFEQTLIATARGHMALRAAPDARAVRLVLDTEIAAYTAAAREAGAGWAAEDAHAPRDLSLLREPGSAPGAGPGAHPTRQSGALA